MLNKVISNSILYSLSGILLRASSILLFPIFSFYLTKEDYGILLVTQSLTLIISSLSNFEIQKALTRFLYSESRLNDEKTRQKTLGNVILISVITNSIVVLLMILLGNQILKYFLNDIPFYPYMFYSILSISCTFLVSIYSTYLKAIQHGKASFIYDLSYYSTNIIFNLFFVVVLKYDVLGLIYSTIISGAIFSIISLLKMKNLSIFKFEKEIIKPILSYAAPLIPYMWLGMGIETVSTIFLNIEGGKGTSGTYYIAITFCSVFSVIKGSIILAITPWFFEFYKTRIEFIKKLFIHAIMLGAIIVFGISIFSFEILTILSSKIEFVEAWRYIPLINIGFLIVFIGELVNLPIYYENKKTKLLILANLGGIIITFLFSYLLTRNYGINGTIVARSLGYLMMTIIMIIISKKVMNFYINYSSVFIIVSATTILTHLNFLEINYLQLLALKLLLSFVLLFIYLRLLLRKYYKAKRYYITYRSRIYHFF